MSADNIKEAEEKEQELSLEEEKDKTMDEAVAEETASEESQEPEKDENELLIEKLEQELADAKDSLLRKAAELENVRKRVQRERVTLFEEAKVAALQDFLPISEDMKRALGASEGNEIEGSFLEGMKLVSNKFEEVLSKYGVEAIDETGVPFDVNLHDAMLRQPAPDKKTKSDTVIQVLESGYKIGNKVIKHAKVIVSE
ncbi:MAG: nucleotide exchange factor GrpE [Balneolaceae bacterium]|nr:nucleotide exchange factor GrpE [Balneolaceae bacterium]MBO6547109.1 nucleotide exchange factor GrpE [Balneolaceae bacterium]MBO6647944.1 nucleotide exchange factor GrpE [Balneolaceae bacterium]